MYLTQIINNYKSIVFDNDGVIMDSNGAKSEAFAKALVGEDSLLIEEFLPISWTNLLRILLFIFFSVLKI